MEVNRPYYYVLDGGITTVAVIDMDSVSSKQYSNPINWVVTVQQNNLLCYRFYPIRTTANTAVIYYTASKNCRRYHTEYKVLYRQKHSSVTKTVPLLKIRFASSTIDTGDTIYAVKLIIDRSLLNVSQIVSVLDSVSAEYNYYHSDDSVYATVYCPYDTIHRYTEYLVGILYSNIPTVLPGGTWILNRMDDKDEDEDDKDEEDKDEDEDEED